MMQFVSIYGSMSVSLLSNWLSHLTKTEQVKLPFPQLGDFTKSDSKTSSRTLIREPGAGPCCCFKRFFIKKIQSSFRWLEMTWCSSVTIVMIYHFRIIETTSYKINSICVVITSCFNIIFRHPVYPIPNQRRIDCHFNYLVAMEFKSQYAISVLLNSHPTTNHRHPQCESQVSGCKA